MSLITHFKRPCSPARERIRPARRIYIAECRKLWRPGSLRNRRRARLYRLNPSRAFEASRKIAIFRVWPRRGSERIGLCKYARWGRFFDRGCVQRHVIGANAIVGGAAPLAIGAGLTITRTASSTVSVAFAGDAATNQGTTFEAMNMAVVLKLPVVFAIENNGFGEHTGNEYATAPIPRRTEGFAVCRASKLTGPFFLLFMGPCKRPSSALIKAHGARLLRPQPTSDGMDILP